MELQINVEEVLSNLASIETLANGLSGMADSARNTLTSLGGSWSGENTATIISEFNTSFNTNIETIKQAVLSVKRKVETYAQNVKKIDQGTELHGAGSSGAGNGLAGTASEN